MKPEFILFLTKADLTGRVSCVDLFLAGERTFHIEMINGVWTYSKTLSQMALQLGKAIKRPVLTDFPECMPRSAGRV